MEDIGLGGLHTVKPNLFRFIWRQEMAWEVRRNW